MRLLGSTVGVRCGGAALQLIFTLFVARLAPSMDEAGAVLFCVAATQLAATLSRGGTELSALRELGALESSDYSMVGLQVVGERLAFVVSCSFLVGAGALASIAVAPPLEIARASATLAAAVPAIPALALVGLAAEVLKGLNRPIVGVAIQNLVAPAISLVVLLTWSSVSEASALSITGAFVAGSLATAVLATHLLGSALGGLRTLVAASRPSDRLWVLLAQSRKLLVVTLAPSILQWTGTIMLGLLAAGSDVAAFAVAVRCSIVVGLVHSAAASVYGPQMAAAYDRSDLEPLRQLVTRVGLIISFLTWPILLLMLLIAPELMGVFGEDYSSEYQLLRVLLLGQLVAGCLGHVGHVLAMTGHDGAARANSLVPVLILIGGLSILVPSLGGVGAAAAAAAAASGGHAASVIFVRRVVGFWPLFRSRSEVVDALGAVRGLKVQRG